MKKFLPLTIALTCSALVLAASFIWRSSTSSCTLQTPPPHILQAFATGYNAKDLLKLHAKDGGPILNKIWGWKETQSCGDSSVTSTGDALTSEYPNGDHHTMSLAAYLRLAKQQAHLVRTNFDFEAAGNHYFVDKKGKPSEFLQQRINLFRHVAVRVEDDLGPYIGSELSRSNSADAAEQGLKWLDRVLRVFGREYPESLPSLFDRKNSFGPFQFTEEAVQNTSAMNQFLPDDEKIRIPEDVSSLRGDAHFRTAYLFALHNLVLLIQGLTKDQLDILESLQKQKKGEEGLAQFIATAHHNPRDAVTAAENWLNHKASLPFVESCPHSIVFYAKKTEWNRKALLAYR